MFLLSVRGQLLVLRAVQRGWGLAGVSFSIGIAFSSVWYPKERQGTALGIFGAGNAGAALTTLFAPTLLNQLDGQRREYRRLAAVAQLSMRCCCSSWPCLFIFSTNKKPASSKRKLMAEMLRSLKQDSGMAFRSVLFPRLRVLRRVFAVARAVFRQRLLPAAGYGGPSRISVQPAVRRDPRISAGGCRTPWVREPSCTGSWACRSRSASCS